MSFISAQSFWWSSHNKTEEVEEGNSSLSTSSMKESKRKESSLSYWPELAWPYASNEGETLSTAAYIEGKTSLKDPPEIDALPKVLSFKEQTKSRRVKRNRDEEQALPPCDKARALVPSPINNGREIKGSSSNESMKPTKKIKGGLWGSVFTRPSFDGKEEQPVPVTSTSDTTPINSGNASFLAKKELTSIDIVDHIKAYFVCAPSVEISTMKSDGGDKLSSSDLIDADDYEYTNDSIDDPIDVLEAGIVPFPMAPYESPKKNAPSGLRLRSSEKAALKAKKRHFSKFPFGKYQTLAAIGFSFLALLLSIGSKHSLHFTKLGHGLEVAPTFNDVTNMGLMRMEVCYNDTARSDRMLASYDVSGSKSLFRRLIETDEANRRLEETGCVVLQLTSDIVDDRMWNAARSFLSLAIAFGAFLTPVLCLSCWWESMNLRPMSVGLLLTYFFQSLSFFFFDSAVCRQHFCKLSHGSTASIFASLFWFLAGLCSIRMDACYRRDQRTLERRRERALKKLRFQRMATESTEVESPSNTVASTPPADRKQPSAFHFDSEYGDEESVVIKLDFESEQQGNYNGVPVAAEQSIREKPRHEYTLGGDVNRSKKSKKARKAKKKKTTTHPTLVTVNSIDDDHVYIEDSDDDGEEIAA